MHNYNVFYIFNMFILPKIETVRRICGDWACFATKRDRMRNLIILIKSTVYLIKMLLIRAVEVRKVLR